MYNMDLSVSLISHNSQKDLALLLPSLMHSLKGISSEILLVDNCSTDSTESFIKKRFPDVVYRRNFRRKGYGANHNRNLAVAKGRYITFMNSDMIVYPETFSMLIDFMDGNDDIGIASPNVLNEDGSLQCLNKRYPTLYDLFLRRFLPDFLKPFFRQRLDHYEMRDAGYELMTDVPFLTGAFMFAKTDLMLALKGFDERFFMYFEDADLSRRVQNSHRTVFCPDAKVVHRWERAAHKDIKWALVFVQSAFRYFEKWGYRVF